MNSPTNLQSALSHVHRAFVHKDEDEKLCVIIVSRPCYLHHHDVIRSWGVTSAGDDCTAGEQIVSMYCIRKGLIRKAHLAMNLKKWNTKHPDGRLSKATPETLLFTLDDIEYFEEALSDVYEVCDPLCHPSLS